MPKQALEENLKALHAELASAEDLDDNLRALLKQVAGDIEELLGNSSEKSANSSPDTLQARLKATTVKFEADHPRLSNILSDLTDTLTKLGV